MNFNGKYNMSHNNKRMLVYRMFFLKSASAQTSGFQSKSDVWRQQSSIYVQPDFDDEECTRLRFIFYNPGKQSTKFEFAPR